MRGNNYHVTQSYKISIKLSNYQKYCYEIKQVKNKYYKITNYKIDDNYKPLK